MRDPGLDPFQARTTQERLAIYAQLRRESPVSRLPSGAWFVASQAGVRAVHQNVDCFVGSFGNRGELGVLVEGDARLFNPYGVILVNPDKYAHVKAELGRAFIDWLVSPEGQAAIAEFEINGEQLFIPNAGGVGGQS